jgi:hypothetical protein
MKLKTILRILVTPKYWVRNHETSKTVSAFINDALDRGCEVRRLNQHEIELDGMVIWAGNYPYSYGMLRSRTRVVSFGKDKKHLWPINLNLMPDRETVFRLRDAEPFSECEWDKKEVLRFIDENREAKH